MTLLEIIRLSTDRVPSVQPVPAPNQRIEALSSEILRELDADGLTIEEAESVMLSCLHVLAHAKAKIEAAQRAQAEYRAQQEKAAKAEEGGFFDALFG